MISEAARRDITDELRIRNVAWSGRLDDVSFLSRLFDLQSMSSTDTRFSDAEGDIWQHRIRNPTDWDDDWIYDDPRFNLLHGPDDVFVRFLCEMVHPVVRPDPEEVESLVDLFNEGLAAEGWEITEKSRKFGKPIFEGHPRLVRDVSDTQVPMATSASLASSLQSDSERGTHQTIDNVVSEAQPSRDQVFISYSHKDKRWFDELNTMLMPLVRSKTVTVWDDTRIKAGTVWREEIANALSRTKVAVLLVSPSFLASEFIARHELPPLLDAARSEGVTVLWIAVRASMYRETDIERYQAANDPAKPLDSLSVALRNRELVRICEQIKVASEKNH